jgi:hypothetical protein
VSRVFMSYRRDDSQAEALMIYQRLAQRLGEDTIFFDLDTLDPGVKFIVEIINAVNRCEVFLAVIGKRWLSIQNEHGRRRLDDPDDILRLEIATALGRDVLIVPVLIAGARMPKKNELPDDLKSLTDRNALEITLYCGGISGTNQPEIKRG